MLTKLSLVSLLVIFNLAAMEKTKVASDKNAMLKQISTEIFYILSNAHKHDPYSFMQQKEILAHILRQHSSDIGSYLRSPDLFVFFVQKLLSQYSQDAAYEILLNMFLGVFYKNEVLPNTVGNLRESQIDDAMEVLQTKLSCEKRKEILALLEEARNKREERKKKDAELAEQKKREDAELAEQKEREWAARVREIERVAEEREKAAQATRMALLAKAKSEKKEKNSWALAETTNKEIREKTFLQRYARLGLSPTTYFDLLPKDTRDLVIHYALRDLIKENPFLKSHLSGSDNIQFNPTIRFNHEGTLLATCTNKPVTIWDVATGLAMSVLREKADVDYVQFNRQGTQLLVVTTEYRYGQNTQLWDIATGSLIQKLYVIDLIVSAEFNPAGTQIVTVSGRRYIEIWDAKTGECIRRLETPSKTIESVHFNPEGTEILTVDKNGTGQIWNVKSGGIIREFDYQKGNFVCARFTSQGIKILTVKETNFTHSEHDSAELILINGDFWTGALLLDKMFDYFPYQDFYFAQFNLEGTRFVIIIGGIAHVWDLKTRSLITSIAVPHEKIKLAHFDPSSLWIVTISHNGNIRIWPAEKPETFMETLEYYKKSYADELAGFAALDDKRKALHCACRKGNTFLAKQLIKGGWDVNFIDQDNNAETPLHCAASAGLIEMVQLLLKNGAHMDALDKKGLSALSRALIEGYGDIAALLITRGANIDAVYKSRIESSMSKDMLNLLREGKVFQSLLKLLEKNTTLHFPDLSQSLHSHYFLQELERLLYKRKSNESSQLKLKDFTLTGRNNDDSGLTQAIAYPSNHGEAHTPTFRAGLALDGEGPQVLITASMIKRLEDELGTSYPLHKLFDCITGSGFGAVIAMALVASDKGFRSVPTKNIVTLFEEMFAKKNAKPHQFDLDKIKTLFKNSTLAQALTRVIIPCNREPLKPRIDPCGDFFDSLKAKCEVAQGKPDYYFYDVACAAVAQNPYNIDYGREICTADSDYRNCSARIVNNHFSAGHDRGIYRILHCAPNQQMHIEREIKIHSEVWKKSDAEHLQKINETLTKLRIKIDPLNKKFEEEQKIKQAPIILSEDKIRLSSEEIKQKNEIELEIDRLLWEKDKTTLNYGASLVPHVCSRPADDKRALKHYKELGVHAAEDFIKNNEKFLRLLKENADLKHSSAL